MGLRLKGLAGIALGLAMMGGTLSAGATGHPGAAHPHGAIGATPQCQAEGEGQPGILDDGSDLLPQATLALGQAIAAAQAAATGPLGEVDLEMASGELVFTVSIGSQDVQINAANGAVVAINGEEIDTGENEATGDNGDTADTGENEATADNGDTSVTGENESTADNGDTSVTGENESTADNGDNCDSAGNDGNESTADDGDTADNGENKSNADHGDEADNGENKSTADHGDEADNGED